MLSKWEQNVLRRGNGLTVYCEVCGGQGITACLYWRANYRHINPMVCRSVLLAKKETKEESQPQENQPSSAIW